VRPGVWSIARHEAQRHIELVTPKMLLAALAVALALGLLTPLAFNQGVHPETGFYHVVMEPSSPLEAALRSDDRFVLLAYNPQLFLDHEADLLIRGTTIHYHADATRSLNAAKQLERTTHQWLERQMALETDQDAAFPVRVNTISQDRALFAQQPAPTTNPNATSTPGQPQNAPTVRLLEEQGTTRTDLTPNQVDPPFPMRSLLLTFAFLIPMNLVGQLYAGTLHAERTRQRGLLLLSTPHSGATILLGLSLPYVLLTLAIGIGVALLIDAGLIGFLGALPILAFVLASSLIIGLTAQSPRSLTFLLTADTVFLSTFLFLPAVFVDIHPIAYMSPVAVIAQAIQGADVALGPFLYATLPLALASLALILVAIPIYREEHLFTTRAGITTIHRALRNALTTSPRILTAGILVVPFALAAELFVLIFAVALDLRIAFAVFILGGAAIEEALKGLAATATTKRPLKTGLLIGGGFFLGEKLALLLGLVGFGLLDLGPSVLAVFGVAPSLLLILGPLLLHSTTATLLAKSPSWGRRGLATGWLAATLIHVSYNATIILSATGGLP
jgi:ABC-type Na+ efflux pump permease subunit